jgi:hypothetical protein
VSEPTLSHRAEDEARELAERGRLWARRDRYVLVFVLIVCSLIATAFMSEGVWGLVVATSFLSATLLVSLNTSDAGPKTRHVAQLAVLVSIAGIMVAELFNYSSLARLGVLITSLVLSTLTPVVIARRLWKHPVINVNTIAGAADIYLLIGFLYTVLFTLIGGIQAGLVETFSSSTASGGVAAAAFFNSARPVGPTDFLYYSFTTLTTVGYGDLTSTTDLGRILSNTEALFGQLYLVTVVAIIVANIGHSRRAQAETAGNAANADD